MSQQTPCRILGSGGALCRVTANYTERFLRGSEPVGAFDGARRSPDAHPENPEAGLLGAVCRATPHGLKVVAAANQHQPACDLAASPRADFHRGGKGQPRKGEGSDHLRLSLSVHMAYFTTLAGAAA